MQFDHQSASHIFTTALLRILERTEAMLKRRADALALTLEPDSLAGLEVQDSDWGAWVQAGGDLLMGRPD